MPDSLGQHGPSLAESGEKRLFGGTYRRVPSLGGIAQSINRQQEMH
jgi:hypothetical protein